MDEFGKYLEEHCNYPHFSVEEIELMQEIWEYQQKKIDAVLKEIEDRIGTDLAPEYDTILCVLMDIKELLK